MGLKFRRGSTAQQSGSLAFGEPYVNTTLGTLIVGGATGDIVLSAGGTGSTGNFGAISGSGLDITGNANIAGNLTLGGAITIGDASSDTVNVVASLSSSLIPSITNAFDLGSAAKFWRDLYISTGSIKFIGTGGAIVGTLSNTGNGMALDGGVVANGNSTFGTSSLAVTSVTGSLAVDGRIIATSISGAIAATNGVVSGSSQVIGILDSLNTFSGSQLTQNTNLATISGSLISSASANTISVANLNVASSSYETKGRGIVSGSSQVTISDTTGYTAFSSSLNSRISTEKGRVDAILLAADADKDSFAEIVTLINSVDLTNDTSFASFYTASVGRLNNLESTSGSVNVSVSNLNTYTGSNDTTNGTQNTRLTALEASASTALSTNGTQATSITNLNSATASLNTSVSNLNTYTGSNDTTNGTQNTRLTALEASASTALSTNDTQATSITNLNSTTASLNTSVSNLNTFSGSANTRFTEIGVVSGSLITSASAAKTTNDSQGVSITNLNSATASLIIETTNLELFSSSALTRLDNLEGKDFSITLTGDVTGTGTVTNLSNVSFATTVAANSVALGTDTTGNYMSDLTQGTGVTITHTPGEGSNATIAIGQSVATGASPTFAGLTINGAITATGDITAYYTSDKRHKNNIQTIPNALEKVTKLNGVTWEWNDDVNEVTKSTPKTGLIAQEVQEVLPEVVKTRDDGFLALDYSKMMGLMVEAIKEQQIQIEELKAKIGL